MSRDLPRGAVRFDRVSKHYVLGRPRAYWRAAWPFGDGVGGGERVTALDDVSFEVAPGEAFALMGANGAGKSTALKCLAGLTSPSRGTVASSGRVVPLIELGIGFHPDLTGLENARFTAAMAGIRGREAERVVDEAFAFAEVEAFADTPVKRYSSGMYARLSFGLAVNIPADVLIVDEVLSVGDVVFQHRCFDKLKELRRSGATLISVSHSEEVLLETCTRGVLLSRGKVEADAPIGDLLLAYQGLAAGHRTAGLAATGPHHLDLRAVRLLGGDGRSVPQHGDFVVEAELEVGPEADHAVLGVAFADRDRRLVWAVYSDEHGQRLAPGGTYRVRVEVPGLTVLPGPCWFEVLAFERSAPTLKASTIVPVTVTGSGTRGSWEYGLVDVGSRWQVSAEPS